MSPRKTKDDAPDSGVGAESLSEEARESLEASVRREREENSPQNVKGGQPSETDFVTPKQDQGQQK